MSTFTERQIQQKLLDETAAKFPEFWQKLYPRRYQTPATYDTPKAVAHAMLDGIYSFIHNSHQQQGERTTTEQVETQWAAHMARHRVPMYYVTYDLADALMKTRPTMVDWMKMKLPYDAAAFMLPKGLFPHEGEGTDVSFVSYSRNFAGDELDIPLPWPQRKWTLEHGNAGFTVIVRTCNGATIHWSLSDHNSTIEFSEELKRLLDESPSHITHTSRDVGMDETDRMVQLRGVTLLFNILLFMTSKPEMVEGGELLKRVTKKRELPVEYWSPRFIGRSYRMRRVGRQESQGGHHASPRGHWVSGFFREQPYGPKFELRRTLWIEPFWRGGEEL